MKSSTELIRNLDPEEAKAILFPAIQKLSSFVYEYGGIVISTAGDGIVATFGAPHALEDHALRACLAALAMQRQIKSVNKAIVLRIGLNSGEVLLAVEGGKYDIVGAVVQLANKMEQTATPGTIRFTQNTLKLVADNVIYESLGSLEAQGAGESTEMFVLKGIKISKSLNELTNQFIGRARFVDRDSELLKVTALLGDAKAGHGNAVSLVADTGFGKSRFMFEIANSDLAKNCNIMLTAAFIHTRDIPLLPIVNLFGSLLNISRLETDIVRVKQLIEPMLASVNLPFAMNGALSLINFIPDDPEWKGLEPSLKRKYIFDVGTKLLINKSMEQPLILILEDMHWVDSETELFIDALISQITNYRVFILISYRPEYHDHWINKPNYWRIVLSPLTNEAGLTMLDNMLGNDPSLIEIKTKLLNIVGGNPFFLEEIALSLIKEQILVGSPKNYRLRERTSVQELRLPESIVTLFQNKIDNLPPREKKILQMASIIGTKFVYSQLIQLMDDVNEAEVRLALDKLAELQYIYESQLYPEPGFGFTHALTYETAYNSILKKTRKELHLKFFQILLKTLDETQIEQIQIAAEHAFLSESWDKAFHYCSLAAQKVYEINAFTECVRLYERTLTAAHHLTQDEAITQKTMRIHYELYVALVPLGRFNEQYTHLEKALEIALSKKDRFFESIINSAFGIHCLGFKDAKEALKHADKAYQIAKELQSKDALVISEAILAHCYFFLAQFQKLFEICAELENTIGGNLEYRTEWLRAPIPHIALFYECSGRALTGDFKTVEAKKEKWFAGSKNLNEPSLSNLCRFASMGVNFYVKGDFDVAIQYLSTALQYSMGSEVIVYIPVFSSMLGEIYARMNKLKEAKIYLDRAISVVEKIHANFTGIFSYAVIPNCLLILGEPIQAKQFCDKAIKILQERNITFLFPVLYRISADIDLKSPSPNYEEIKHKLDESLRLATEAGMMPTIGHCHQTFAGLYQKMGDLEKRKSALNSALASYEKLGMNYWVEQIKALTTI